MDDLSAHSSVTSLLCTCKFLQRAADDPRLPILWHERTGEYHFVYHEPGSSEPSSLVIYYCPCCGGAAPHSKRESLFVAIPTEEENRLRALLSPIRTVRSAFKRLGKPDEDNPAGLVSRKDETETSPASVSQSRTLTYKKLSSVADVDIVERPDGKVYYNLQGKYIENLRH